MYAYGCFNVCLKYGSFTVLQFWAKRFAKHVCVNLLSLGNDIYIYMYDFLRRGGRKNVSDYVNHTLRICRK